MACAVLTPASLGCGSLLVSLETGGGAALAVWQRAPPAATEFLLIFSLALFAL